MRARKKLPFLCTKHATMADAVMPVAMQERQISLTTILRLRQAAMERQAPAPHTSARMKGRSMFGKALLPYIRSVVMHVWSRNKQHPKLRKQSGMQSQANATASC